MLAIRYDRDDWATNFIPLWVEALAAQVASVDVLALQVGTVGKLPPNVRVFSMGKERGAGRLGLLANFYRQAARLLPSCDAVFVHMIPRYALLAAPLALPLRKPMTLWYTHREASRDLQRALPLVRQVATATESSFPLQTDKLRVLGHGIDADFYAPLPGQAATAGAARVVQVARLQPIKRQNVLLEALNHLPEAVGADFIGAVPQGENNDYARGLQATAAALPTGRARFLGGRSAEQVREVYQQAAVAVNLSPVGLFDKAALESMAVGTPTIVTNPAFAPLLGEWRDLLLIEDILTPSVLAARIADVLALPLDALTEMGNTLRGHVIQAHSLHALMPRLARLLASA